jgi:hypothetical protein
MHRILPDPALPRIARTGRELTLEVRELTLEVRELTLEVRGS